MGDKTSHEQRRKANEELAYFLRGDINAQRQDGAERWATIAFHYSARELIHTYLAQAARPEMRHPNSHGETARAIAVTLGSPTVPAALAVLRDLSFGARYIESTAQTDDSWWTASYPTERAAADQAQREYEVIRSAIIPLL